MSLIDLTGKKGLVVGIANANSFAHGCAKAFHNAGAPDQPRGHRPGADGVLRGGARRRAPRPSTNSMTDRYLLAEHGVVASSACLPRPTLTRTRT